MSLFIDRIVTAPLWQLIIACLIAIAAIPIWFRLIDLLLSKHEIEG